MAETFVVLGFGGRGGLYARLLTENGCTLNAICDIDQRKLDFGKEKFDLRANQLFLSADEMFAKGKIADVMVIATMDRTHYEYAVRALKMGYHLLLEKPIAETIPECREIMRLAKENDRKVAVCHVLRYSPFYQLVRKYIEEGSLGEVVSISQTENVGYFHQAHSFVRGNWGNSEASSPMILQKCCHDTDILCYLTGLKCEAVSSFGSLTYFRKEYAPPGSADYCYICPVKDDCLYDCTRVYQRGGSTESFVPCTDYYGDRDDREAIVKHFSDPSNRFARCVYRCDNDVVDHQVTNLLFERGVTAQLTMTAFSATCNRNIKVHLTRGEIVGDMGTLTVTPFGDKSEIINISDLVKGIAGHGGGDARLVEDFVALIRGQQAKALTDIEQSVASHEIALAAERSRLDGGSLVKL